MPIKGLTDRGLAFPCIGKIRKGAPKTEKAPGKDLDYFRVVFDQSEEQSADLFKKVYGPEPRSINFIFPPHQTMEDIASFWLEAYTAGRMVARSDGEIYTYLVDTDTGEILVLNGINRNTGKQVKYNPDEPAGHYVSKRSKKKMPVFCKPVGRLKVVVPELRRAAWLLALTSSTHDCMNLSGQIQAYMTDIGNITNIPFVLKRSPRKISTPSDEKGKRVRREKSLLSIEINPSWFGKLLDSRKAQVEKLIQPGGLKPAIPEGMKTDGWDDLPMNEEDNEFSSDPDAYGVNPIKEGEIIERLPNTGDYTDLEFLADTDAVTAFWHLKNRIGFTKEDAKAVIDECNGDFKVAFMRLLDQAP